MSRRGSRSNFGRGQRPGSGQSAISSLLSGIDLVKPSPELFDKTALKAAQIIAENRSKNKPTQLRRFYDELVMWDTRINQPTGDDDRKRLLDDSLPFIRMMNAKAAYADGRGLVDRNFKELLQKCLGQVKDPKSLRNCRTFFEAFLGFYKFERPKES